MGSAPRGRATGGRAPIAVITAFAVVPLLFHAVIVYTRHVRLSPSSPAGLFKLGFVGAAALSHWAIYGSLLVTFGSSLRRGRVPLITAMARRMHGELSEEMVRYTGQVTRAWCGFFVFQLSTSILLFCFAPLLWWSTFVNLLDIPMVAAMFGAEHLCRRHCLRNPPRLSFSAILNLVSDPAGHAVQRPLPVSIARER